MFPYTSNEHYDSKIKNTTLFTITQNNELPKYKSKKTYIGLGHQLGNISYLNSYISSLYYHYADKKIKEVLNKLKGISCP